jgi:hypothetical protein
MRIFAFAVVGWIVCGLISFTGEMGHERGVGRSADALCRSVNSRAVCDDRLATDRSSVLVSSILGGPISLICSAALTGFFYNGFSWSNT